MKKTLLLLVLAFAALHVKAQENDLVIAENSDTKTAYVVYRVDKDGKRISNSYSGDIVIPEKSYSGYPVTMIYHQTFEGCINLTSIKIPSTVKFIDWDAFRNSSLTEITIPASVDSISEGAFFEMSSLKKVTLEDGASVLHFACGQKYGGEGQFSYSHQAIEEAYIGRPYTTTWGELGHLDSPLFQSSETLRKVTFGDYVNEIHDDDFSRCNKLTTVVFGKGTEVIGEEAFSHCTNLAAITLSEGLKKIDEEAFYDCGAAKTITLPNTLTEIGWGAFKDCKSVSELTIPASVVEIADEAFLGMESLKKLTIADGTSTLHFGYGMLYGGEGMFKRQPIEVAYIGRNTTSEANGLFRSNETLVEATLGDACTEVPDYLFRYCDALKEVSIGKAVSRIGNSAFESCEKLTSLFSYNTFKTIGDKAFYDCHSIYGLDLASCPLEEIGADAFCYCKNMTSLKLPATMKSIGNDGFYGCESLKEITCLATVPPTCGNWSVFRYIDKDLCKLLVPQESIDAYKAADVWKDFFNIETGLNSISSDAEASAEWFDLRGRSIDMPRKGLNIIRQGGKTLKVVVR